MRCWPLTEPFPRARSLNFTIQAGSCTVCCRITKGSNIKIKTDIIVSAALSASFLALSVAWPALLISPTGEIKSDATDEKKVCCGGHVTASIFFPAAQAHGHSCLWVWFRFWPQSSVSSVHSGDSEPFLLFIDLFIRSWLKVEYIILRCF